LIQTPDLALYTQSLPAVKSHFGWTQAKKKLSTKWCDLGGHFFVISIIWGGKSGARQDAMAMHGVTERLLDRGFKALPNRQVVRKSGDEGACDVLGAEQGSDWQGWGGPF